MEAEIYLAYVGGNMGYYKDLLKEVDKIKDKLTDMVIAREVSCIFGKAEKEFDDICVFIRELYFDSDSYDINQMCIATLLFKKEKGFESYGQMFAKIETSDIKDYIKTKEIALKDYEDRKAWSRKALINIANAGFFFSNIFNKV